MSDYKHDEQAKTLTHDDDNHNHNHTQDHHIDEDRGIEAWESAAALEETVAYPHDEAADAGIDQPMPLPQEELEEAMEDSTELDEAVSVLAVAGEEEELNRIIEELCISKAEEFAMLGYEGVSGKDIWEFVSEAYHQRGYPPLHRLINDILSLRVTDFMNWLTLSAYKGIKFHE